MSSRSAAIFNMSAPSGCTRDRPEPDGKPTRLSSKNVFRFAFDRLELLDITGRTSDLGLKMAGAFKVDFGPSSVTETDAAHRQEKQILRAAYLVPRREARVEFGRGLGVLRRAVKCDAEGVVIAPDLG